jgi:hypothetical protein
MPEASFEWDAEIIVNELMKGGNNGSNRDYFASAEDERK